MIWTPHITVASILKKDDRYLFVQERKNNRMVINQPAGHWERGETLLEAVVRETLEETAWLFEPQAIIGIYQWHIKEKDETYLRFCFSGTLLKFNEHRALDPDIDSTIWLSEDELRQRHNDHRSPLVQRCMDDYAAGVMHDLKLVTHLQTETL